MIFKDLWILGFIPLAIITIIILNNRKKESTFRYPSFQNIKNLSKTWKIKLRELPLILRLIAVTLLVIALAGPRSLLEETRVNTEGVDVILAIDASGSMAAEDFVLNGKRKNRLTVVKNVVEEFIDERPTDRLGLIAFAGDAYTVSPLTLDHSWLKKNLERIELKLMKDGTAIGSAINSSLARLRKSDAKSKVIILLTDGMNNAGKTNPLLAARAAEALKVKIYTIGAGSKGQAPFPVKDIWGRERYRMVKIDIDEKTLKEIAQLTQGQYYRATDTNSLREIYKEINQLEKTKIESIEFKEYKELFSVFLIAGVLLMLIEQTFLQTLFLKVP